MDIQFTDEDISDIRRESQLRRVLISTGIDTPRLYDRVFYKILMSIEEDKKTKEKQ